MRWFDDSIITFFNQFAQRFPLFDSIVVFFSNSDLMKGGVMIAGIWWAWFYANSTDQRKSRSYLLTALLGALVALTFARILAHGLPMRMRPILDPTLHFKVPNGAPDQSNWTIWSSFPSDHASLFFALLTGIWLVNRRAGIVMLFYVLIAIAFPRIYIGIHYPTDILGGAILGVGSVLACSWRPLREPWTRPVLNWFERWPGLCYAALFIVMFQIATLFWDIRTFLDIFDISV
jgi:undecaprenyl-diphosphatase